MVMMFKSNELVEFAVQIEKNGEAFYRAAAKKTKSSKISETFLFLADEEVSHRHTYEEMLKTIEDYNPPEMYPEEYFQYLKAYADTHIFVNKDVIEKKAEEMKSDKDAIDIAIGFEKDSILYYLEMINLISESDKKTIDKIIKEEHRHYLKLTEIKKVID